MKTNERNSKTFDEEVSYEIIVVSELLQNKQHTVLSLRVTFYN